MSGCNHNCGSCAQNCSSRTAKSNFRVEPNANTRIKKIIGVVSGKGGVGKSMVTSLMAVNMARSGYTTAILDADITGPSIPQAFGISGMLFADENGGIYPAESPLGIRIVSTNLVLENPTDPVVWRGPVIAGMVKQFYTDVNWGEVDYMFVDMPPGTGDVPLTVFQSLPIDGIIIVSTPQQLVSMIVEKAVKMANMMNVPVLGLVENMSYVVCDNCGNKVSLFGDGNTENLASQYGLEVLAKLPLDPSLTKFVDEGQIESYPLETLTKVKSAIESL